MSSLFVLPSLHFSLLPCSILKISDDDDKEHDFYSMALPRRIILLTLLRPNERFRSSDFIEFGYWLGLGEKKTKMFKF